MFAPLSALSGGFQSTPRPTGAGTATLRVAGHGTRFLPGVNARASSQETR